MLSFQKDPETSRNNGIYWLASYPKSGNTWFRLFLSNLLEDGNDPVSINSLQAGSIVNTRAWLDNEFGFDSADLYQWEIDQLRPTIYDWMVEHSKTHSYHKTHDACWQLASGKWNVSARATAGAIYFLRNPLDVAVSYANHRHCSIDEAISCMMTRKHCLSGNKRHRSLIHLTEQRLLTWSQHVISWVDNPDIDTHVVRYEDMHYQPRQVFTDAVNYLKLPNDARRINKALQFSDFSVVYCQETEKKFHEGPLNIARFFRKGIVGDWKETLTHKQVDRLINDHYDVMQRFGYLDEAGLPRVM